MRTSDIELPFTLPLRLTSTQRDEFDQLADSLIAQAVTEWNVSKRHSGQEISAEEWKAVKSRERVTVYKRRFARSTQDTAGRRLEFKVAGSVQGALDDVMYGEMSPTADSLKIKSFYVEDGFADGRVLHQFKSATEQDPFRFVGIKWMVTTIPGSLRGFVKPRDAVILAAMGVRVLTSGERVGYHLMHSVELPELCPELHHLGILRFKISLCTIFRQLRKQTVELFTEATIDPRGNIPDHLATKFAVNGMISCTKLVACAENKKLAWLANEAARQQRQEAESQQLTTTHKKDCAVCSKPRLTSVIGTNVSCALCFRVICTKCYTAHRLFCVNLGHADDVAVCVECIKRCHRVSSAEIARFEHLPGALARKQLSRKHS